MHTRLLLASSALGCSLLVLSSGLVIAQEGGRLDDYTPVTNETLLSPPDGDWLHWRRTYDGWGYSPLDEINKDNVKDLTVAWTWSLTPGATETTPIVHDGILYVHNNLDKVQALDGATGDLLWEYVRELPEPVVEAGNGNTATKRNMSIYQDKIILATSDTHIIALDAKTGQLVWDVQTADWNKGWRYSAGPVIADGVVIQGMTGCGNAQPGGCFITGHNPDTGEELWRFNTIAREGEAGNSWNGIPLESRFGASVWLAASYDPETKTVFSGVGQPYPWIAEMSGLLPASTEEGVTNDALYTDSTLALDPQTGELKWHHQYLKNDTWDLDYIYERILVDLPVDGTERKQVVTTGKLGIIESLDRETGEWLWAKETVPQNVVAEIDPETGEKTINQEAIPHIGETTVNCPADPGGRGWPATAYSPRTETLYLPLNEFCSNTTPQPLDPGQVYTGGGRATFARVEVDGSDGNIGRVDAIKLTDQSTTWSYRQRAPMVSALLPTGGGLVFGGDWNRYFYAFDDETGDVLWKIRTNNAINSFPVSYQADGKQYVAVAVGNGSSQARALAGLTPELVNPTAGSVLWVFALPEETETAAAN
jgi:PQQ-dependent dehydrogenase (methanol/ethanol family)